MNQHTHHHDHDGHDHHCDHDHIHAHNHQHETHQDIPVPSDAQKAVFVIQQMDCPTEERLIRAQLEPMEGVVALQFNLLDRELTVHHNKDSVTSFVDTLTALDMRPQIKSDSLTQTPEDDTVRAEFGISKKKWWQIGIAGCFALAAEIVAIVIHSDTHWSVIALALTAIILGGLTTLKKGWIALRHLSLNMNFLMTLAVIGAAIIGQWPEAAMVIVLFTLSEMIESLSMDKARNAIKNLLSLAPEHATIQNPASASGWETVPAKTVTVGAIVRIKPGERIPLDGTVIEGHTSINQAPITGESLPVNKEAGDVVFAGTINEEGVFTYQVTATQKSSTLSRIIDNVQQAQGDRAPTQRFVDQFAKYYIPVVVILALLVAIIPPVFLQEAFYPWLYKALVLLVIACPCALVISTPITIVSGLATAARHGILIKGGTYLELGRKLSTLGVDKTGTITTGKPVVTDVIVLHDNADKAALLQFAASLAHQSNHPVSLAVAAYWEQQENRPALLIIDTFTSLTGKGSTGQVQGDTYHLGNHRLVHELGQCNPDLENSLQSLEMQGKTAIVLCKNHTPMCIFAVADTIRQTSKDAVSELHQQGVSVALLTGDNTHTAHAIAKEANISKVYGDCLPEDKLHLINAWQHQGQIVGMVGDGINDAPALAKAHIGFAMGAAGTDTAIETADIALMNDDLLKIPYFIRLSQKTHRVLMQNISIALGIKFTFLLLAVLGKSTLWMAVFADIGASLIVIFNGLRLLYDRNPSNIPKKV